MTAKGHILIVGLGSIGRRHLFNLRDLGWRDIRLLRSNRSTLPAADLGDWPVSRSLAEALEARPRAVIVASPTSLHLHAALPAARHGAHLLIEKPLSHNLIGCVELQEIVRERGVAALVGHQFRFDPGLRALKQWIDDGAVGEVLTAQAHFGEFLPGMHPWEDYRHGYAARPDLGGGVLLTLCHPFDYLRWLCGDFTVVSATEPRLNPLQLSVETCVDVSMAFAAGASGHVHVDFLQQPAEHRLQIVGTAGTATWLAHTHTARLYRPAKGWIEAVAPPGYTRNSLFVDELRHFLACLDGDARPVCTIDDALATMRVIAAARQALRLTDVAVGA